MKKYHTLLVVAITILFVALLTWVLPITYVTNGEMISGEKVQAGIFSLASYSLFTFYNFIYVFIYLLFVGGLYGLLGKCSAYRVMLDKIVDHVKKFKILYLVITVLVLSVVVSFTGYTFEALVFLPFIASIVLLLGYDRITAALVTVGSISTGVIGSLFGKLVAGKINSIIESTTYTDLIIPKVIILVLCSALLILFVILYAKKKSVKENVEEGFLIPKKVTSKTVKVWPLITILSIFLVVFILSGIDWSGAFKVSFFTDMLTTINSWPVFSKYIVLTIGVLVVLYNILKSLYDNKKNASKKDTKFMSKRRMIVTIVFGSIAFLALLKILLEDVFKATYFMNKLLEAIKVDSVISGFTFEKLLGSVLAFGSWTYNEYLVLIIVAMIAIKFVYRIKMFEVIDNIGDGFKKVLYAALVVLLSYTVLILISSHPIGLTLVHNDLYSLLNTNGLNVFTYPIATLVSALFNSDFGYYEYGVLSASYAASAYTGSGVLPLVEFFTQTMYGFAMYFAPTSVILLFTLSLLDIKYTTWLKKIGLYLLLLLLAIFVIYLYLFNVLVLAIILTVVFIGLATCYAIFSK